MPNEGSPEDYNTQANESDDEKSLPFGMSGVTGLLERLRDGAHDGWEAEKREMVARYLLDLQERYWMSDGEIGFCRRFLLAG